MQNALCISFEGRAVDSSPDVPWCDPPDTLMLSNDDVHVWQGALDLDERSARRFEKSLSPDEQARAADYRFAKDRCCFVAGRGILRTILGRYLGVGPEQVGFEYNRYGKPSLSSRTNQGTLQFNLSHSAGLALIAVTRGRGVGVDVEQIVPRCDGGQIAERFFSAPEVAAIRLLSPSAQMEAFFRCWTRKEASLKARGLGLALLDAYDEPAELSRWSVRDLDPQPGYVGAVVVEGHASKLTCWRW